MTVDRNPALAEPPVEDRIAPVALHILPVGRVRLLVSEGRIGLVQRSERERVDGLQASEIELFLEIVIRDPSAALRQVELEEADLRLLALAARHRFHDCGVCVHDTTRGLEGILRGAGAIHRDLANDDVRDGLDTSTKHREHLASKSRIAEHRLHGIGGELPRMLLEHGSEVRGGLDDLAVGRGLRWGHDLGHGVILFSSIPLSEVEL